MKTHLVGLFLCLVGAATALLLRRVPIFLIDPHALPPASEHLKDSMGPFSPLLAVWGIGDVIRDNPQLAVAASGFLLFGLPLAGLLSGRLANRFAAAFNDEVLTPIARQGGAWANEGEAPFLVLPWCLGEDGPRREAWKQLHQWVLRGSGLGRGQGRQKVKLLSAAVLVGRSGSGKSRMAGEFGRFMARRDLLGGATPGATFYWRLGVFVRRSLWSLMPRADDPWDAGVLRHHLGDETFD